jgi:predicted permease
MLGLLQYARYALRSLARRPGFTAAVVLTIALGVGANVAIFGVVRAALLRPLPYAQPDRLVHLFARDAKAQDGKPGYEFSYPDFLDLRERTRTLAGVAGYHTARLTLTGSAPGDRSLVLPAARVTANFFDVLGVPPLAGRRFVSGEDAIGAAKVAVVTHALWQRAFAGDPAIVGKTVMLDAAPHTVVGVLPASFTFAGSASADVWVPIDRPASMRERRGNHWLKPVARLKAGVTADAARRDLARVMAELEREHRDSNQDKTGALVPLRDQMVGTVRPVLLVLYGAVAVVLLVACGNVANLLLMRGAARERELTIRAAIGAGRGRIARQLMVESLLLALAGGALGLVVAWGAMRWLVAAIPVEQARQLPYLRDVAMDPVIFGYAMSIAIVTGLLAGLAPALRAARSGLAGTLRRGTAGATGGVSRAVRDGLVVAQLAFAVVLLSGAALFAGSLARLLAVDTGFRAEGVLTMHVPLPRAAYPDAATQRAFFVALQQRVAALPGVTSAGVVSKLPLDDGNVTAYELVGHPPEDGREPVARYRIASPEYFRTLGIPLVAGRLFANEDSAADRAVVINRAMAKELTGTDDPSAALGRRLVLGVASEGTVIGVVGDVTVGQLEDGATPTMYWSWLQSMEASMRLAIRTSGDPHRLAGPVRAAMGELDAGVGSWQVYTMEELVDGSQGVFLRRYPMVLVGAFALVALVLALVGTYGVVSYTVAQRVRELGIRVALGARPGNIRGLVLREAGTVAIVGVDRRGFGTLCRCPRRVGEESCQSFPRYSPL